MDSPSMVRNRVWMASFTALGMALLLTCGGFHGMDPPPWRHGSMEPK
jgi:hypothetical protein